MDNVALARINRFSSEQLITLTINQLEELVTQAVEKAIQPLQNEVKDLQATITGLNAKVSALETTQEQDLNRVCLDIAFDRRRLAKLEKIEPQPLQKDRGDILRALIVANGGKMLAKDARQKMRLDKVLFSQLLAKAEDIEIRLYRMDKRQKLLVLK